ncbi:MAG: hypothetical protein GX596_09325 [Propionibacterium sp.]|nr:hypothetical protein [Propionibacterium sp.]
MKLWHKFTSFVSWHRRLIAALAAALCVAGIVALAQAPPPAGEPVVAAAGQLPAGHRLTDADLTLVDVPSHLITDTTLRSIDDALDATTTVALDPGQPITGHALLRGGAADEGRALVPIAVPEDELRALLRPGTTVSLIVALGEAPELVTNDARVAALGAEASGTLAGAQSGRGMVVVDVPGEVASVVAVLGQSGQLAVILGRL